MSDSEKSTEESGGEYLTGKLLLAMPGMGDPRFDHAVIFMCGHDENGAMGLTINHTLMGIKLEQLLDQLGLMSDIKIDLEKLNIPVMNGGPVDSSRGFLLHRHDFEQKDTIKVNDDFGVTGTIEALKDIAGGKGPKDILFILGYAGWGGGQLEAELHRNAWLVVDPDPDLIFKGEAEDKWNRAVQKLGIDPAMLTGNAGSA